MPIELPSQTLYQIIAQSRNAQPRLKQSIAILLPIPSIIKMCCCLSPAERRERRERRRLAAMQAIESLVARSQRITSRSHTKSVDTDKTVERGVTLTQPPAYSDVVAQSHNRSSTEKGQMAELEDMEKRHATEKNALWARISKQENKGY